MFVSIRKARPGNNAALLHCDWQFEVDADIRSLPSLQVFGRLNSQTPTIFSPNTRCPVCVRIHLLVCNPFLSSLQFCILPTLFPILFYRDPFISLLLFQLSPKLLRLEIRFFQFHGKGRWLIAKKTICLLFIYLIFYGKIYSIQTLLKKYDTSLLNWHQIQYKLIYI